jgi:aminoglycoside phosphotransferase family enzyme/predicted kinase
MMIKDDQTSTIAFLKTQAAGDSCLTLQIIETHISIVFLIGNRAFKLKRAVKLPYVDFSTPDLRLNGCAKELALNARTAPDLYLGVRRITLEQDGRLAFDGAGHLVDAVVEMVRFDQDSLFDAMAVAGRLTPSLMSDMARVIARFHQETAPVHIGSGAEIMANVLDLNERAFAECQLFDRTAVEGLNAAFRTALARYAPLLNRREAAGKVRRCHGDLHLRNIYLSGQTPELFDCIEFNDAIATIDTLYDLAFLLMDLWHRGLPALANRVMNHYLDASENEDGFVLLPFFMALRAAIRAHVTATQIEQGEFRSPEMLAAAKSYFDLSGSLLHAPYFPALYAIGGFSGSGKSTVAEALAPLIAPPPGARIIESDRIRKALHHVSPETRLGGEAYRPEISHEVYRTLGDKTGLILSAGGAVIVDAVFDDAAKRALIEGIARQASIPFTGVWLDAASAMLRRRVGDREGGVSDATVTVLDEQLQRDTGSINWLRLDASRPAADIARAILALPPV